MDPIFRELGRGILDRWKRDNFSLEAFPEIARAALDGRPPSAHVDLAALMRDFMLDDEQPPQSDSDFGQPELVVFSHPRFYIQVLFWLEGTTAIHQHAFSGAFHVMHGSSIHARYEFEKARPITPFLHVGDVRMKKIELLETGRTVPIRSGAKTIHSLFHLDSPSVTVVVRTQHDPGTGPQLNYLPPHVAIDPLHHEPLMTRREQLLDVLEQVGDPGYADLVTAMVAELDFERGFHVLQHAMPHLLHLGQWDRAIKTFQKKHGPLAAGVEPTLREELRREAIKSLRASITEPEHRFFLALLMNAPTRRDLLALVGRRFPKQAPASVVARWVEELTEVSDEGAYVLDASFPETIDVAPEFQGELMLAAFGHFLKGGKKLPRILRERSAAEIRELRAMFADSALGILTA